MADQKHQMIIKIKAVIDTKTNRVLFVESDADFVDHLLSFMTLPIGTILRLVQDNNQEPAAAAEEEAASSSSSPSRFRPMKNLYKALFRKDHHINQSPSTVFRCMKNLYNSVENLEAHHLNTEECKQILLFPRRQSESICLNLNLKIDDTEPTMYSWCTVHGIKRLSCDCDDNTNRRRSYRRTKVPLTNHDGALFVKKGKYVTSEGMHVTKGSLDTCISLLDIHGISKLESLERREVDIGVKEVLKEVRRGFSGGNAPAKVLLLLKCSLFSDTPLTDVILQKGRLNPTIKNNIKGKTGQHPSMGTTEISTEDNAQTTLTLVVRKSTNQVLYAKANEDFVDVLFSFLTIPLGSVIKLCGGRSSLASFDNIYESIGVLNLTSKKREEYLAFPKLDNHQGCGKNQLLGVEEAEPILILRETTKRLSIKQTNPKTANKGETGSGGGYLKGPSSFMVTNDLMVTPVCCTAELFQLKKLKVPTYEVEERVVTIGKQEALNLLKASLISNEALSSISSSRNFYYKAAGQEKVLH